VATRAGISERVFSDIFPTVDECYRSAFVEGLDRLSRTLAEATDREVVWLERVRSGLVAMLGFLDDEPAWARLLVLETPLSGALTFECRRGLHELVARLLDRGTEVTETFGAGRAVTSPTLLATLTGELVVGGVFSVVRTSMLDRDGGKLVELAPSLMAFIVAPYLGRSVAQAELDGRPSGAGGGLASRRRVVRAESLASAAALPIRATHRTTMVLRAIAGAPYSNNREVARSAGLVDEGQTSKLLARLERQGVIENVGLGPARGEPNAWVLTGSGRRAVELINDSFASSAPRPRRARTKDVS
jgi:AcrR family transcriptional regulator